MLRRMLFLVALPVAPAMAQGPLAPVGHDPELLRHGLLAVGAVAVYYLILWAIVGRDPAKGRIVPRATPPEGISPAGARYLMNEASDDLTIAVALVSMGVRGFLEIRENGDRFTLARDQQHGGETVRERVISLRESGRGLAAEEQRLAEVLLRRQSTFTLSAGNWEEMREATGEFNARLAARYGGQFFRQNQTFLYGGILFSTVLLLWAGAPYVAGGHGLEILRLLGGLALLAIFLPLAVITLWPLWGAVLANPLNQISRAYATLQVTVYFCLPLGLGVYLVWHTPPLLRLLLVAMTGVNLLFAHLLRAPTTRGRKVLDEMEGFIRYLSGEGKGLPVPTPALFERYLPYALALGVAQAWTAHCRRHFDAGVWSLSNWYSGSAIFRGRAEEFIATFTHRLPTAIAHARHPSGEETLNEYESYERDGY